MRKLISVVMATSGQYEDWRQRLVAVYLHPDLARKEVERRNAIIETARHKYRAAIDGDSERAQDKVLRRLRRDLDDKEVEHSDIHDLHYEILMAPFK